MYINVLELLEDNVRDNPNKTAFQDENTVISYIDLFDNARAIATYIGKKIGTNVSREPIAVCIDRNVESLIIFMGILYSGNFYVPIDVSMPMDRISLIFDDLNPKLVIASSGQRIDGVNVVDYVDMIGAGIDEAYIAQTRSCHVDIDPMYAIFTSGSTGKPKGVIVSHRSVIDLVEQFACTFTFSESPVFGNQAPFDFDVSVKDIYDAFYLHGTVSIIPKQFFSMPVKLIEYINTNGINTIIWAVSAMRIVENFKTFSEIVPNNLRLIMFSGETMPVKVLNYWREYIPNATYVNLYGPTEITCNCTYYIVNRKFDVEEALPIGIPFRNTQILLMDTETGEIIQDANRQGEICVRGTCLALGYYNASERTSEAFTQSPLTKAYPDRIYKTGDMGFFDKDGLLQFASRKDYQIKHMGHRIELGEIEVAVNAIEYIDAAVCVFDKKREKIVLFYQPNSGKDIFETTKALERDIVKNLGKKLQKFMWPNVYKQCDNLPMNKNGKIDRVYLSNTL